MKRRAYHALRVIIDDAGGEMVFERRGRPPGGAWVVTLRGRQRVFNADGMEFMDLARYYVPKCANPTHARHYSGTLADGAAARFLESIRSSAR